VTLPSMANARKKAFVDRVKLLPNRIAFVVDEFENLNHVQQRVSEIAEISLRDVTGNPKSGRHTALKRIMDIAVSATALVIGAPILGAIALLIRLDSPGPALFKQPRHGFNNRVFDVYKFRSMRGMTGWAQINGSRGPLHSGDDVAERVRLDVEYIERANIIWDIYIMLKTLPVLLGDRTNVR